MNVSEDVIMASSWSNTPQQLVTCYICNESIPDGQSYSDIHNGVIFPLCNSCKDAVCMFLCHECENEFPISKCIKVPDEKGFIMKREYCLVY